MNKTSKLIDASVDLLLLALAGICIVFIIYLIDIRMTPSKHISSILSRPVDGSAQIEASHTYVVNDTDIEGEYAKCSKNGEDIFINISTGEILRKDTVLRVNGEHTETEDIYKASGTYANVYSREQHKFICIQHVLLWLSDSDGCDIPYNEVKQAVTCDTLTSSKFGQSIAKHLDLS